VFFFQAEDGIRDFHVTGVQTCALPILADQRRDPLGGPALPVPPVRRRHEAHDELPRLRLTERPRPRPGSPSGLDPRRLGRQSPPRRERDLSRTGPLARPRPVTTHHDHPGGTTMSTPEHEARAALMRAADAGDTVPRALGAPHGPTQAVQAIRERAAPPGFATAELTRRLQTWHARLDGSDPAADLEAGERTGARLIIPGDPEWPTQLDALGAGRPLGLWLHGTADLRFSCLRSVAVVGARAATSYGVHVAAQFGVGLSEAGWTVVSGGAFGIDGAAHRGSLAAGGTTVVVLACGVDYCYPAE